jgi:hypothetical protein
VSGCWWRVWVPRGSDSISNRSASRTWIDSSEINVHGPRNGTNDELKRVCFFLSVKYLSIYCCHRFELQPHLGNGRCASIYLPVGTFSFLRSTTGQDLVDTTGKTPAASKLMLMRGQLIRPEDGLLSEGTPAKWQEGPGGCKEVGLSPQTVIRGEWKDCSVWEWIGW